MQHCQTLSNTGRQHARKLKSFRHQINTYLFLHSLSFRWWNTFWDPSTSQKVLKSNMRSNAGTLAALEKSAYWILPKKKENEVKIHQFGKIKTPQLFVFDCIIFIKQRKRLHEGKQGRKNEALCVLEAADSRSRDHWVAVLQYRYLKVKFIVLFFLASYKTSLQIQRAFRKCADWGVVSPLPKNSW